MTDLTPHEPHPVAPERAPRLPNLERYLDLDLSITAAMIGVEPGSGWTWPFDEFHPGRRLAIAGIEGHAHRIEARLAGAVPVDVVERCRNKLREATAGKPSSKVTMAAVGLFVSARVRQPPNPEGFMQALAYDLGALGFSPTVVVVALQKLRREAKFFPEIPEVIAACEAERNRYRAMLDRVDRTARYRVALEQARADVPRLMAKAESSPEASCYWPEGEADG